MIIQSLIGLGPLLLPQAAYQVSQPTQETESTKIQLTRLIPEDAFISMAMHDLASMAERREDSQWLQLATDPRWLDVFGMAEEDQDEASSFAALLPGILPKLESAVGWIGSENLLDVVEPQVNFVLRGEPQALTALIFPLAIEMEVVEFEGWKMWVDDNAAMGISGDILAIHIAGMDDEDPKSGLVEILANAIEPSDSSSPFHKASLQSFRKDSDVEFLWNVKWIIELALEELDQDLQAQMPDSFMDEFTALEWFYISGKLGEGTASEWSMTIPLLEDGLVQQMAEGAVVEIGSSLERIPKDCMAFSCVGMSMPLIFDLIMDFADDIEPESSAMMEQTFEMFLEEYEIDIMEDLINNVNGIAISFMGTDLDLSEAGLGTIVCDLEDAGVFRESIELIMDLAASASPNPEMLIPSEEDWGALWTIELMPELEILFGIDGRSMLVSSSDSDLRNYLALEAKPDIDNSVMGIAEIAQLKEAMDGPLLAGFQLESYLGIIQQAFEEEMELALEESELEEGEFETDMQTFEAAMDLIQEYAPGWLGVSAEVDSASIQFEFRTL